MPHTVTFKKEEKRRNLNQNETNIKKIFFSSCIQKRSTCHCCNLYKRSLKLWTTTRRTFNHVLWRQPTYRWLPQLSWWSSDHFPTWQRWAARVLLLFSPPPPPPTWFLQPFLCLYSKQGTTGHWSVGILSAFLPVEVNGCEGVPCTPLFFPPYPRWWEEETSDSSVLFLLLVIVQINLVLGRECFVNRPRSPQDESHFQNFLYVRNTSHQITSKKKKKNLQRYLKTKSNVRFITSE